jgi:hypothetical protein
MRRDIRAYMISCAERRAIRRRTLASLAASDWSAEVFVQIDEGRIERREERQTVTAQRLLERAVWDGPEFVLFLEDDLEFNRHLRHNLDSWGPLRRSRNDHFFGSLYDPNVRRLESVPEHSFFVADPDAVYGSQAFVLSLVTARFVVAAWDEVEGMQDIKMSRLASRLGPIHYHLPSLVQHTGLDSTWGGPFHATAEFQLIWKA